MDKDNVKSSLIQNNITAIVATANEDVITTCISSNCYNDCGVKTINAIDAIDIDTTDNKWVWPYGNTTAINGFYYTHDVPVPEIKETTITVKEDKFKTLLGYDYDKNLIMLIL